MRASVIVATYNGAAYVRQQLESVLCQSVLPSEVIVSDDGSTDATVEVVKEVAVASNGLVRVVSRTTPLGYARNFQKAKRLASGDVVFLCDQDDVWRRDKIERVIQAFRNGGRRVVCVRHDMEVVGRWLQPLHPSIFQLHRDAMKSDFRMYKGCSLAFRNDWLSRLSDFRSKELAHDDWWFANALADQGVATIRACLVKHRIHENNVSGALPDVSILGKLASLVNGCLVDEGPRKEWSLLSLMHENAAKELHAEVSIRGSTDQSAARYLAKKLRAARMRRHVEDLSRPIRIFAILGLICIGAYRRTSGVGAVWRDLRQQ